MRCRTIGAIMALATIVAILLVPALPQAVVAADATAEATRIVEPDTIAPGETVQVTVEFESLLEYVEMFALVEDIPPGWGFARVDDDADFIDEDDAIWWYWIEVAAGTNRTVVYTLTAPVDAVTGEYPLEGVVKAGGVDNPVLGHDTILVAWLDIVEHYRDNFGEPGVCDLDSVLAMVSHWNRDVTPGGFDQPPTLDDILDMISCWLAT